MAASATIRGATAHFSVQNYFPSPNKAGTSCSFTFPAARKRGRRFLSIRSSSSEVSPETTAATEAETAESVEAREEPPSLISALNVEKALRGIAITDADHYGRLGLRRGCSYDQVSAAYKTKVEELNNQDLEEEELTKNLQLLKESYSILSSVEERRLYDWSLARSENSDTYKWPFEVDISQAPAYGTPPPLQKAEDVEPTRLVGYFILGWVLLSCALSTVLNL